MTLEQTMVAVATKTVKIRSNKLPAEARKRYKNHCENLPALLVQSGLVQTMAYLLSANQAEAEDLAQDIAEHFTEMNLLPNAAPNGAPNGLNLLHYIQEQGVAQYRVMSYLAGLVAIWQKRMAKALLKTD